jgi:outer membrane protein assembly factor BamB
MSLPEAASLLRFTVRSLVASALLLLALAASAWGQEWTRFRGPNGSGIGQATTVPVRWMENEYHWKVKLPGVGHSSPVLWGERLFVTSGDEATGTRLVECLRSRDGQRLWSREFAGTRHNKHEDNSFASATPVVDERHVYVSWGTPKEFLVLALGHGGNEVWRTNLGPYQGGHGFGASMIVHEDLVIVPNDQDGKSSLLALDRGTGKLRWNIPRRSKASYSTPCVRQLKGQPAELIFTSWEHGITSIDPKAGRINWEMDVFAKGHMETAIASPIVTGDLVIGTCGWLGVRKEVIAMRPGQGSDKRPSETVYTLARSAPLVTTPLVVQDLLFLWSDEGMATCSNVHTGEVYWRERVPGNYYGSPVCVGKHLYCMSREGEVVVLAASKQYGLVARNPLGEGSHSTPAIANGMMYLRTFSHLLAIGGAKEK